jgi:hypothetical protein
MEQETQNPTSQQIQVSETEVVPDYILVPHGEKDLAVLILDGECKGVKYTYGVITPKDNESADKAVLEYHYDVIENPMDCTTEQLHKVTAVILNQIVLKMVAEESDLGYTVEREEGEEIEPIDDGEVDSTESSGE